METPRFLAALSFLERFDRGLAESLDVALRTALNGPIFVYWRYQSLLTGKDETTAFGPIFEEPSTVAVVIMRPEWGTSGATLAEAQAIKRRHFAGDRNFLYVIGQMPGLVLPDWMPPGYVYFDASRYSLDEAVEGITDLVRMRTSVAAHPMNLATRMRARAVKASEDEARRRFSRTEEACAAARASARAVIEQLVERAKALAAAGALPNPRTRTNRDVTAGLVAHRSDTVVLSWENPAPDAPAGSLWFSERDGLVQLPHDDARPVRQGRELVGAEIRPEFENGSLMGWRVVANPTWQRARYPDYFDASSLVEFALARVFER